MSRTAAPSSTTTISTAAAPDSVVARNFMERLNSTAALDSTAGQKLTAALDSTAGRKVTAGRNSTAVRLLRHSTDQRRRRPSRALVPAPSAGSIMEAWREASRPAGSRVSEVDSTAADSTAAEVTDDSSQGSIRIGGGRCNLGSGKQSSASTPDNLSLRGRRRTGTVPRGPGRGRTRVVADPRRRQQAVLGRRQGPGRSRSRDVPRQIPRDAPPRSRTGRNDPLPRRGELALSHPDRVQERRL